MISFILFLFVAAIIAVYVIQNKSNLFSEEIENIERELERLYYEYDDSAREKRSVLTNKISLLKRKRTSSWITVSIIAFIGLLITFIHPFKIERVDSGNVALLVNLTGSDRGVSKIEYKSGWVFYNDWINRLYEYPTYQQHVDYDTINVITKGGFVASIRPSFNYSLIPGQISDMFSTLRKPLSDIENQWLYNALISSVNDVSNTWTIDSIFNQREKFEVCIIKEVNERTSKWFNITQLRTNIMPPNALKEAIESKTRAIQNVQIAENNKKVAIARAAEKIAIAKGDSADLVIRALASAQEVKITQQQLTPLYIEYLKIQRWNGAYPTTILGSSSQVLMSLPNQK